MSTPVPTLAARFALQPDMLPLLVLAAIVAIVTIVALCRADREDIPQIFASFATAFGFHRSHGPADRDDTAHDTSEPHNLRPLGDEEKA